MKTEEGKCTGRKKEKERNYDTTVILYTML